MNLEMVEFTPSSITLHNHDTLIRIFDGQFRRSLNDPADVLSVQAHEIHDLNGLMKEPDI
ncbi:hypothetical protein HMPREF1531_00434 [Propionibacterium sp. oral taxon 192 str. F0372]|nr:hypothetical protein HMPREF1531_00434 [Propionibacterium sp. oral taxon 192 str. F0372]